MRQTSGCLYHPHQVLNYLCRMEYSEFGELEHVLLEESWVLQIAPSEHQVGFRLEAVLLPGHPAYTEAKPGETYGYRSGWLNIASSEAISIELSGAPPAVDASGTTDLGNIDRFAATSGDMWVLEGSWGRVTVHTPRSNLLLD